MVPWSAMEPVPHPQHPQHRPDTAKPPRNGPGCKGFELKLLPRETAVRTTFPDPMVAKHRYTTSPRVTPVADHEKSGCPQPLRFHHQAPGISEKD